MPLLASVVEDEYRAIQLAYYRRRADGAFSRDPALFADILRSLPPRGVPEPDELELIAAAHRLPDRHGVRPPPNDDILEFMKRKGALSAIRASNLLDGPISNFEAVLIERGDHAGARLASRSPQEPHSNFDGLIP